MSKFWKKVKEIISTELQKDGVQLVILRLFIGLGWMRAGVEKLIEPGWHSGDQLQTFLHGQMASGDIPFPFYNALITDLFIPHSIFLSKLIMVGQFYAGAAIFFGIFTTPALLAGLFMNLNFLLAGRVNPSAFYLIIQTILLTCRSGHVLGGDALIEHYLTAHHRSPRRLSVKMKSKIWAMLTPLSAFVALRSFTYVKTYDPALSIDDPAMLLFILMLLNTLLFLILWQRAAREVKRLAVSTVSTAVPFMPSIPRSSGTTKNQSQMDPLFY